MPATRWRVALRPFPEAWRFALACVLTAATALAVPGDLDTSFGAGGKVTTPVGSGEDYARGMAVQSDGKIVVAGWSFNGTNDDFAVVRYLANGDLDTAFGTNGKVTTPVGADTDQASSVAVQSDGKIVVAGFTLNGTHNDFALVRYTANGVLDPTFGTGGKVTTSFTASSMDAAYSVAMQSDGKIVVAGFSGTSFPFYDFAVARYTASGTLDTTFSAGGKVTTPVGSNLDLGRNVVVQSDGKIVVAGYSTGTSDDFAVVRYTTTGALDTTFSGDGKVTTAIGTGADQGYSVALQSDGKIVVAGFSDNGSNWDVALVRYTTAGVLDATFSGDGKVTTLIGTDHDFGSGVAVQSDGKIVVAGYSFSGGAQDFALARYMTGGALDTGFGTGGVVTTAFGSNSDLGQSVAVQNGKIVVAGHFWNGSNSDFALARYLGDSRPVVATSAASLVTAATAMLNGTVNPNGLASTALFQYGATTSYGSSASVTLSPNNGSTPQNVSANLTGLTPGTTYHCRLATQNVDGTADGADMTFTTLAAPEIRVFAGADDISPELTDGQVATVDFGSTPLGTPVTRSFTVKNAGSADLQLTSLSLPTVYERVGGAFAPVTLVPNAVHTFQVRFLANTVKGVFGGSFSVANDDGDEAPFNFSLTATAINGLNPATLDATFGGTGEVTTLVGSNSVGNSVAVQSDGKIIVAGWSSPGDGDSEFALVRYTVTGALDTTFGTGGKVTTTIGTSEYAICFSVAVQSDGKIVAAGYANNGGNVDFALARYQINGSLDTSFGTGGKVTTAIGSSHDYGFSLAVQSDGKILVSGSSFDGSNLDFALVRYTASGALDSTFSGDGKLTTAIGSSNESGNSVAVQGDGKIVVAGYSYTASGADFAVVRYTASGGLDATFSSDGKVTTAIGGSDDSGHGVVVQSDGKIVVAGESWNGVNYDFALVRYTATGALDTTFSSDGKVTTPIGSSTEGGRDVTLQSDGKIVVAGYSVNESGNDDFALVRYTTVGALDTGFGLGGMQTTPLGSGSDYGASVAVQGDGKIVVAGHTDNGGVVNFALVRYGSDLTATVTTTTATALTLTSATLNGTVNPNGVITSAWFEFGSTTSYGSITNAAALLWHHRQPRLGQPRGHGSRQHLALPHRRAKRRDHRGGRRHEFYHPCPGNPRFCRSG